MKRFCVLTILLSAAAVATVSVDIIF